MTDKPLEVISVTLFARREELRRVMTELVLRQSSDSYLVDYNYNIELCMSSSTSAKVMTPLLILELILRSGGEGAQTRRVVLEMNQEEATDFVGKLNRIEQEIIQAE